MPDRLAHVAGRAEVHKKSAGSEDRVVGIHDVAALAVQPPASGDELHWPQRSSCGRPVDPAEQALDEIDGCEIARMHARDPLGFVVKGLQRVHGCGIAVWMSEVHVDEVVLVDARERIKRVEGRDGVLEGSRHLGGKERNDRRLHVRVARELVNTKLLLARRVAIRVCGRLDRELPPDPFDQRGRRRLRSKRRQLRRRLRERDLGTHDPRRFVVRARWRLGILSECSARVQREQQRDQGRRGKPAQADPVAVTTDGRDWSGSTGKSSG